MSSKTIAPEIQAILAASEFEGGILTLPPGQLDRKLYEQVAKAIKALGGSWNRKAAGFRFERDPRAGLAQAQSNGVVVDTKKALQQFWTPPELAGRMCALAGIGPGASVLEPSAGVGHIAEAALKLGARVQAVEIDPETAGVLRRRLSDFPRESLVCDEANFLDWSQTHPHRLFGAVVMNPPFSRNQDLLHVRAAFKHLEPGGKLVAICSPHGFFAQDRGSDDFRRWIKAVDGGVQSIPPGTFKESGTDVRSMLVRIEADGAGRSAADAPLLTDVA